jgi:ribosome-binding factor A
MDQKHERFLNQIREKAAEFISHESNRTSLITVTSVVLSNDESRATIYITVLPSEKEEAALDFLKRQRSDLRDFLKKEIRSMRVPFLDIAIDMGEKNRHKIQEISENLESHRNQNFLGQILQLHLVLQYSFQNILLHLL